MKIIPIRWFEKLNKYSSDKVYKYQSKWLIYNLSLFSKKGLWTRFTDHISLLEEKKLLQNITEEDIDKFFDDNADIEFEMIYFQKVFPHIAFLKIKNQIYCYVSNKVKKNDKRIDVRFFFDVEKFLTLELGE